MSTPEFETHGREHDSSKLDDVSDVELGINVEPAKGFPTPDDIHQGETAKYVTTAAALTLGAIAAVVAGKKFYDKRKGQ